MFLEKKLTSLPRLSLAQQIEKNSEDGVGTIFDKIWRPHAKQPNAEIYTNTSWNFWESSVLKHDNKHYNGIQSSRMQTMAIDFGVTSASSIVLAVYLIYVFAFNEGSNSFAFLATHLPTDGGFRTM